MKGLASLSSEPQPVQELIRDKPDRWEYLLASQLLSVRMQDINLKYEALVEEGAQQEKRSIGVDDFVNWIESTTDKFGVIVARLEKLLGVDVKESLGFSGREADASELQAIANELAAICKNQLTWEQESRGMAAPSEFNGAIEILQGWTVVFLDTINDFIRNWDQGFRQPLNEQGKLVINIRVDINPPPRSSEIRGMIERQRLKNRLKPQAITAANKSPKKRSSPKSRVMEDLGSLCFTAVDFEIANPRRDSLCAIGVAQVQNGVITKIWKQLVKPEDLEGAVTNQSIHRISAEDLSDAPAFPEIWDTFRTMIEDRVVVAHNAEFDMNVLQSTLDLYGIEPPEFQSLCTSKLSHVAFPQLDDYRLADVCQFLDLKFIHHSCDEDARVCAEIAIQAIPRVSINKFDLSGHDLTKGFVKVPSKTKVSGKGAAFVHKDFDSSLLKPQLEGANPDHPFYGKRLVFTGDLNTMTRSEAAERVRSLGTDINKTISRKTQIVVVGEGAGPSKMKKIHDFQEQGIDIWIIDEDEFLQLIRE